MYRHDANYDESASISSIEIQTRDYPHIQSDFTVLRLQAAGSSETLVWWHAEPLLGNYREANN
jgi:hypothetical protein